MLQDIDVVMQTVACAVGSPSGVVSGVTGLPRAAVLHRSGRSAGCTGVPPALLPVPSRAANGGEPLVAHLTSSNRVVHLQVLRQPQ